VSPPQNDSILCASLQKSIVNLLVSAAVVVCAIVTFSPFVVGSAVVCCGVVSVVALSCLAKI
jgi:hypothetical protein